MSCSNQVQERVPPVFSDGISVQQVDILALSFMFSFLSGWLSQRENPSDHAEGLNTSDVMTDLQKSIES